MEPGTRSESLSPVLLYASEVEKLVLAETSLLDHVAHEFVVEVFGHGPQEQDRRASWELVKGWQSPMSKWTAASVFSRVAQYASPSTHAGYL